jgi:UDP-N-acetylglucosamine 2-epimerase (hydrolysing)
MGRGGRMKNILFITGTRADFGKLKSLINITSKSKQFSVNIFATGMHLQSKYGYTIDEIYKCGYKNIFPYINQTAENSMDCTLAKTIEGLSNYVKEFKPDLIIIHGDRVEALAGAIVGTLNNILVAHIEGGEVSGTIDELLRHSISKLCHIHFVSNAAAKKRLIQMGEMSENIFIIGSPDVDVMLSKKLPDAEQMRKRYGIKFKKYSVLLFHPVTTEISKIELYSENLARAITDSNLNYVVIYPNNDLGSSAILNHFKAFQDNDKIKIFPSIRFEYFLSLLKNASMIVGNSSAGIREAPYYGVPVVNIGTRQQNRALHKDIINTDYSYENILKSIRKASEAKFKKEKLFGKGNSDKLFSGIISDKKFWNINIQKQFRDIV